MKTTPSICAISNDSERYYKLEGYLFPDTYEFYVDEDPSRPSSGSSPTTAAR